jgi:1-deoxy-D-xylulose-5-phosphate synthase
MLIMTPKDENELQHMLKTALEHNGPAALRYPRGTGLGVPMDQELKMLSIGKGEVLQDGDDVVIIAIGNMVKPAQVAGERLTAGGISAAVVNARFVKPLDEELILRLAKKTGRVVTVEEHALQGGFGSAVLECIEDNRLSAVKILRIGLPDRFIEHGPQAVLRQKYGLDTDGIFASVRDFVEKTSLKAVPPVVSLKTKDA